VDHKDTVWMVFEFEGFQSIVMESKNMSLEDLVSELRDTISIASLLISIIFTSKSDMCTSTIRKLDMSLQIHSYKILNKCKIG